MTSPGFRSLVGAAIFTAVGVQPAVAAVTYYANDLAGFLGALQGVQIENFNDNVLNAGLTITGASVVIDGGNSNRLFDIINDGTSVSTIYAFATPINGFGGIFNLAVPGGPGTGISITIDLVLGGLSVLSQQIPNSVSGTFWGFVSDVAFDEVRFSEGSQANGVERYWLNDLRYGAAVPEPATIALLGGGLLGLVGLGALQRRRRPVAAPV